MQLTFGNTVFSSDGEKIGVVEEVIVNPTCRTLTHLVIRKGLFFQSDQIIHIDQVKTNNTEGIFLKINAVEVEKQSAEYCAEEYMDLSPIETETASIPQKVWRKPLTEAATIVPPGFCGVEVPPDLIIEGEEVTLLHDSRVFSEDGTPLGKIDSLLSDEDGKLSHVVVSSGVIFPRPKLVPAEWLSSFNDNSITINMSVEELKNLSDYAPNES